MCGIAGVGGSGWPSDSFETLFASIGHRGPDRQGIWRRGSVQLGMNRLRFRGPDVALPIAVPAGAVAFNGQVYGALAHDGSYRPVQDGLDSEISVLLAEDAVADGMYAWALALEDGQSVVLRSDPDFIKPLFYRVEAEGFAFCSEPAPLLRLTRNNRLNRDALAELFAFGWYLGDSLFAGGVRFTAAEDVMLSPDGAHPLAKPPQLAPVIQDAASEELLRLAVRESVRRCAMGTGPLGLALSGGLDSSILAHELNELGVEDLVTISVCSNDDDDGIADLRELGLPPGGAWERWRHRVIRIRDDRDFLQRFHASTLSFAQPSTMSSLPLYHALAEEAAEAGVRVLLTGEGVDELFGGYASYSKLPELNHPLDYYCHPPRERLVRQLFGGALADQVRMRFRDRFASCTDIRAVEREIRLKRLLLRSDLCLMACSIEGRVPFLHNGIPQIAQSIPWPELVRSPGKSLLRAAYAKELGARATVHKTRFKANDSQLLRCLADGASLEMIQGNLAGVFGRETIQACLAELIHPDGFDADIASLLLSLSFLIEEGWVDVDA